ncbi:hypothetical protein KIN34_10035 [Cellulomonas sp. DKR-3]|uniref:FHA domain-containing protein n=1 Tax=Cellulomonas fulva TaxID=2835530 RepID=A0ABS5TZU3_9CELL|nr:DUF5719 family protein [Cellulomonas fulva]MBT0994626.1 hypothetical protein [Cellulomonas fulva]
MSANVARFTRAASGVAVLALAAAVVVGSTGTTPPDAAASDVPGGGTLVQVPPSPTRLVCPGPLVLPEDDGGDDDFDPVPVDPVTSVVVAATSSGGAEVTTLDGTDEQATLGTGTDAATVAPADDPLVVLARPTDERAAVAAAGGSVVSRGDLRGLAAASCQVATTDAWLVGGSTELGATALLVLQNPGTTPAVVHLDVFGPTGQVDLDTEQYLVAPGSERVVVLGGLAPEQRRIAVHVTATGGRVAAHVQDSTLEGFTPTGTELVVPGAPAARRQVLPAVSLPATEVDGADAGVLRLLAPGGGAATARVRLLGPDGVQDLPGAEALELPPGTVTDVPLGGLPAGAYTFVVDADRPVVAGAMLLREGDPTEQDPTVPTSERGWIASVATSGGMVAVPDGAAGSLILGAVAAQDDLAADAEARVGATLRLVGTDGSTVARTHVEVRTGRTDRWTVADLAPAGAVVAGVQVVPDDADGAGGTWLATGLVAGVPQSDGTLLSVLVPAQQPDVADGVVVRQDPRLGS